MPRACESAFGPVGGDDARAFLAAMLQREQTVVGQYGGIRMAEDGENAAFVLGKCDRVRHFPPQ